MKQKKKKEYRCSVFAALAAGFILLPGLVLAEDVKTDSVTVTATRSEVSLQDAPGAITIITQEDLADMPDGDLLEAIRETSGISLIGRSVGGRKSISIRGMDSRHSLILVDGKRIASSTAVFGHSNFENNWLTSENIERIEIVRGPLSALYGSEAIGGVVNIITKPISSKDWSFGFKTGGGVTDDDGGDNGHVTAYASGPIVEDRFGLYLSAGYNRDDDTPSEDNPRVSELEGIETYTLNTKVAFTPNKNHTLEVAVDYVDEERWRGASRGISFYKSEYAVDKGMYSLGWKGTVGPTRSVVQLYRSVIEKDSMNLLARVTTHYPEELTNDVLDAQTTFGLGSMNLVTLGGEFRQENLESTTLLSGEDDVFHAALFIQDEIELFDKLRITLGARYDDHENFGSEISPRIYGLYQVTDAVNLKLGYGHAFNAPTIKQGSEGYFASFGPHSFVGNPDLGPETSNNYEIGAEYTTDIFWAKGFYFYNDIEDMIENTRIGRPERTPGGGPPRFTFTAKNVDEVVTQGVETEIGVALDSGFEITANYTYLDAEDKGNNERLAEKPKHTFNSKFAYTLEQWGLTTALRFQFIGDQVLEGNGRNADLEDVPDYSLWHFSARKSLGENFELQLGVENIGDVRLADESDLFAYEERGRFFYAGLKGSF